MTTPYLTKTGRCSECGRAQVRYATDGNGQVIDIPDPCVHLRPRPAPGVPVAWPPTSKKPEMKESAMAKLAPEAVKEELREVLAENPGISQTEARRLIEKRTGCDPINPGTFHPWWKQAIAERNAEPESESRIPMPKAEKAPPAPAAATKENGNGAHAPANRIAAAELPDELASADLAFSEAVHPQLDEIRSLRATYETGQYVRIEEEDGTWCLRVMLDFPTRGEALNALTGILGIVE